jgi:hypothetical protein
MSEMPVFPDMLERVPIKNITELQMHRLIREGA